MKLFLQLISSLLILLSYQASAGDLKTYAGANCLPINENLNTSNYYRASSGRLENNSSTSNLYFICPLIKDNVTQYNKVDNVVVWVNDNSDQYNVHCTLRVRLWNSNSYYYKSRNTNGKADDYYDGSVGLPFASFTNVGFSNYTFLTCNLPKKQGTDYPSSIVMYRMEE